MSLMPVTSSDLTVSDFYCGAGGSMTGMLQVPGVVGTVAVNHWRRAIETHSLNHPSVEHACADVTQIDPRLFPRTTMAWFSPSCTHHSVAQGIKRADKLPDPNGEVLSDDAAERSRATMWDVVRFSEYHQYRSIVVENVVDVYFWPLFAPWLAAMDALGYNHEIVWLNSMHAQLFGQPAPQSRDRIYIVFWRAGDRRPDLDRLSRPWAVCPSCGPVRSVKTWKRPERQWGRYRAQYTFSCPNGSCAATVEPDWRPAADIIDWSLPGTRIGDRKRPLAAKTMTRIQAGIDRYWGPFLTEHRHEYRVRDITRPMQTVAASGNHFGLAIPVEGREGKAALPISAPVRTMTTRSETALAMLVPTGGTWRTDACPASDPFPTRTTRENDAIAFVAELRGGSSDARGISSPLATVCASGNHHALVMRNNTGGAEMTTPVTETIRTITTGGHQSLLTADHRPVAIDDVMFRMLEPNEIKRAMDFPTAYQGVGTRREQVRLWGNAVTPPAARDIVGLVAAALDPSIGPDLDRLVA